MRGKDHYLHHATFMPKHLSEPVSRHHPHLPVTGWLEQHHGPIDSEI
jgi:hypothetical protein